LIIKKWKKLQSEKKIQIVIKKYIIIGLHEGFSSYRRSHRPSKENIQHFKALNFFIFCGLFLPCKKRIRIKALLNPDPIRIQITGRTDREVKRSFTRPLHQNTVVNIEPSLSTVATDC
jgi:hypothetical protein